MALNLRSYQEQTLAALREGFAKGKKAQILYAPPGAGKTEMAIALMAATQVKGNKAAMLLDRVVLCDQTSNTVSQIKAGKVRAIGVTSPKRLTQLPDVPTLVEQGLSGFELNVWHGLYAPKGIPGDALGWLRNACARAVESPGFTNSSIKTLTGIKYADSASFAGDIFRSNKEIGDLLRKLDIKAQ